ncbi:CAP domain-containing protein [Pseudomonas sp. GCM10022188]|uniref:CAP domain-containing protein n=1 Tax=Pseudomonas TaxID=286 RepID=UPI001E379781|nr:CAP domain-containing protein [Pseudomonas oryzagri]MCC6075779.1 CAP domain-containing protein [Pseudomonas oryzagri]
MHRRPARLLSSCLAALLLFASADAFASTGSRLDRGEVRTLLQEHNRARAQVRVPPLRWSPQVATSAQRWADHLADSSCRMRHSRGSRYGENLFIGTAGYYGVGDAAQAWAAERRRYRGGPLRAHNWAPAGHYTQMVWRDTRQLGCGVSACDDKEIVVCHYEPKGNYLGRAPY